MIQKTGNILGILVLMSEAIVNIEVIKDRWQNADKVSKIDKHDTEYNKTN